MLAVETSARRAHPSGCGRVLQRTTETGHAWLVAARSEYQSAQTLDVLAPQGCRRGPQSRPGGGDIVDQDRGPRTTRARSAKRTLDIFGPLQLAEPRLGARLLVSLEPVTHSGAEPRRNLRGQQGRLIVATLDQAGSVQGNWDQVQRGAVVFTWNCCPAYDLRRVEESIEALEPPQGEAFRDFRLSRVLEPVDRFAQR